MNNGNDMKFLRQVSVNIFKLWHPAFFMAGLHLALYFASHAFPQQPVMAFIAVRTHLTFMTPLFWQVAFLGAMLLLLKFDHIHLVMFFSAPAILYGWFVVWYGLSTHSLPSPVMVFVLAAWLGALGVVILSKVVAGLLDEREYMALKIADLEEKLKAAEVAKTA